MCRITLVITITSRNRTMHDRCSLLRKPTPSQSIPLYPACDCSLIKDYFIMVNNGIIVSREVLSDLYGNCIFFQYLSFYFFVYLFIHLFICLFIYLFVLFVYSLVGLFLSACAFSATLRGQDRIVQKVGVEKRPLQRKSKI